MNMRTTPGTLRRITATLFAFICIGTAATPGSASSQILPPSVRITVPSLVEFTVNDVSVTTDASTGVTRISYDLALLGLGRVLRISVKGDSDIVPPSGAAIPASNVSWRTSNVAGGVGLDGVLSKTTYTPVYEGNLLAVSGHVDLLWSLSSTGVEIRAGTHQLPLRWKIESVFP